MVSLAVPGQGLTPTRTTMPWRSLEPARTGWHLRKETQPQRERERERESYSGPDSLLGNKRAGLEHLGKKEPLPGKLLLEGPRSVAV